MVKFPFVLTSYEPSWLAVLGKRRKNKFIHSFIHVVTLICMAMLGRRPILRSELATKTRQAQTENTIKRTKHIRARRNSSEQLPNDMCEISAVTKFS